MYKTRTAWAFLAIPLVFLLVFTFIPTIAAFGLSFTDYNIFNPMKLVGLENYIEAFQNNLFRTALKNTVLFWLFVTPLLTILPVFVAVLLNQKVKGVGIFRVVYYFPVLISVVITAILWRWMFAEEGILNFVLSLFGAEPVGWLTDPKTALFSVALVTIWQGTGYYALFYLAALQAVPTILYEAADLDGAGFWRKQFSITIPMIRPTMFFVFVISTMSAFKEFTLMLTMTGGGPLNSTKTVVYLIFEDAFKNLNMGYASAVSFILFLILLVLTIINQKVLDRNATE